MATTATATTSGGGGVGGVLSSVHHWSSWTDELRSALLEVLGEEEGRVFEVSSLQNSRKPSSKELDCLEKAIRLDKENSEILFAYCKVLAEILREQDPKGDNGALSAISFGSQRSFGNGGHLRNYIFAQCSRLFELDPISLKHNLGVASLLLSTVPFWARNPPLAKLCLERALIFHPESAKALCRMGMYKLMIDKDVAGARNCFKIANSYNPEDFTAASSMLYSIFEDILNYKGQIHLLLKNEFEKPFWTDEQRAALYFIRGLFQLFYQGFEKNMAISWTTAFTKSEKEFQACLERFGKTKNMYRFPLKYNEVFTLPHFCDVLKESFGHPEIDDGKLKAVRKLIKTVGRKEAKEKTLQAIEKSRVKFVDTKKLYGTSYACLENVLVGCQENVKEAFETFGISEKSPKCVVDDKYRKICRELESIKKQPECNQREIADKMLEFNSAFATLHRHFDRQSRDAAAALAHIMDDDDDDDDEVCVTVK